VINFNGVFAIFDNCFNIVFWHVKQQGIKVDVDVGGAYKVVQHMLHWLLKTWDLQYLWYDTWFPLKYYRLDPIWRLQPALSGWTVTHGAFKTFAASLILTFDSISHRVEKWKLWVHWLHLLSIAHIFPLMNPAKNREISWLFRRPFLFEYLIL